ncbi:MAG: TaqI-like C-terminal specificity domain-containing protein [Prolixibacteraceae bacterium]
MNLSIFNSAELFDAATDLFSQLGIRLNSNTKGQLPVRDLLKQHFRETEIFKAIERTFFIGIIDDSVFSQTGLFDESYSYKDAVQHADKSYDGLMFFALELTKQPTRTEISELTRAFNRISQKMPVALLLKYNALPPSNEAVISIAISERFKYKQNWRQGEKAGKVIILRDIRTQSLHSGHERILIDLVKPVAVTNYEQLHAHWLQALDVSILNKKFFRELADWYFWAMDIVQFPDDIEKKRDLRNATNLIRLITRIIFIWFIKEKKLVPANLFRKDSLNKILQDFASDDKAENYYKAILQNLFFGTLNQRMDDRGFVESHGGFKKGDQGVRNLYRYADKFSIEQNEIEKLFKGIPFLNGGLFDCLDKTDEETNKDYFVDGFTRRKEKQAIVPDFLFFGEEREVNLSGYYDPDAKKPIIRKVKGLVALLESYKFTVAENTPIEEEIALDPELLGKVFENLLASYNPETQTTARKQTGSFYTPRDIVNYMVDESLIEYLKQKCKDFPDLESRLRDLFSYSENINFFNEKETKILIKAINNCKMLDPASGSGAFPMGMLHKMVHILTKLDPDNSKWKAEQEEKIIGEKIKELKKDKDAIEGLSDAAVKEKARKAVDDRLKEIKEIFESENNFDDYSRKLFLIENCIYGVDIQPIAVQICKLRFFISLIIDQNKQEGKENLGIRSLPNLETKFVAANTLIGLEIPTSDLFSENNPIKALQEELKNVRHLYFNAKTRKEKLQFQIRDKQLRKAMSEKIKTLLVKRNEDEIAKIQADIEVANLILLKIENEPEQIEIIDTTNLFGEKEQKRINKKQEKVKAQKDIIKLLENNLRINQNGLNKDAVMHVAENIASFDPYDQNHFAKWFEPEWMFGKELEEGFDIVISNPPFGAKFTESEKQYFKITYKHQDYQPESFLFFTEKSFVFLKTNAVLAFIIPNTWLTNLKLVKIRRFLTGSNLVLNISHYHKSVFDAVVDTEVVIFKKGYAESHFVNVFIHTEANQVYELKHDQSKWKNKNGDVINIFTNEKIEKIVEKLKIDSFNLSEYCDVVTGMKPYQVGKGIPKQDRSIVDARIFDSERRINKHYKKLLRGRDIERYEINWDGNRWIKYGDWLAEPRYSANFEIDEKIVIRQTGDSLIASLDTQQFICMNNLHVILLKRQINSKYILALLNSSLLNFYFQYLNPETGEALAEVKKETVEKLLIKKAIDQQPFITMVEFIIQLKKSNKDSSFFERLLDAMVYELYLPEAIHSCGAEVLENVSDLTGLIDGVDGKNLQTIEGAYKKFSDPNHPVSAALLKLLNIEEINIIEGRK